MHTRISSQTSLRATLHAGNGMLEAANGSAMMHMSVVQSIIARVNCASIVEVEVRLSDSFPVVPILVVTMLVVTLRSSDCLGTAIMSPVSHPRNANVSLDIHIRTGSCQDLPNI